MEEMAGRLWWSTSCIIQEFVLARKVHLCCSNIRADEHILTLCIIHGSEEVIIVTFSGCKCESQPSDAK